MGLATGTSVVCPGKPPASASKTHDLTSMACWNVRKILDTTYGKRWAEMRRMLLDGEIDVLTSAVKTPEREAKYLFSIPIVTSRCMPECPDRR